jgi:hypothetical protein
MEKVAFSALTNLFDYLPHDPPFGESHNVAMLSGSLLTIASSLVSGLKANLLNQTPYGTI